MPTLEYLRHFRFASYAIFDLMVSFWGMYLLAPLLSRFFAKLSVRIPKQSWLFWTLPIGIAVHLLSGTMTPMTRNFLDLHGYFGLKAVIILMVWLGARGVGSKKP